MTDPRLERLLAAAPGLRLTTDAADLEHYGRDWTRRWTPAPLAIALPSTVDEVQALVRWANDAGVAIVPSGGRTGLSGGAVAANGELVVSLERMNRVLDFDDYSPLELAQIFGHLCERNHYELTPATRAKLIVGLTELHRRRDRHFGNGRSVRNLFEHAIRRLANRVADIARLGPRQLMLLEAADIEFADLPAEWMEGATEHEPKFRVMCAACAHTSDAPGDDQPAVLFLSGRGNLTRDFNVSFGKTAVDGSWTLRLDPKQPQAEYDWLEITASRDTLRLQSLAVGEKTGSRSTFTFTNFKENPGLADNAFEFSIPKGAEVTNAGPVKR